jgi:soluble lytic murein transglycosylase-like protein
MVRIKITAALVAAVALLSVAMGMREREARTQSAGQVAPVVLYESLEPVVVNAARPSLSQIVALVLDERPAAAELSADVTASSGFPAGSDEAYIAGVLSRRTSDRSIVNRIAAALVKEGRRRHIGRPLLLGVLLTENPLLDPRATSFVGARGLMQVMPFHAGKWGCGSSDLFDVESNICHGVAVLADNLANSRSLPQALLGYNGCVRGTNTPDCWKYPRSVYRRAEFNTNP